MLFKKQNTIRGMGKIRPGREIQKHSIALEVQYGAISQEEDDMAIGDDPEAGCEEGGANTPKFNGWCTDWLWAISLCLLLDYLAFGCSPP